jgi:hypothetical protein
VGTPAGAPGTRPPDRVQATLASFYIQRLRASGFGDEDVLAWQDSDLPARRSSGEGSQAFGGERDLTAPPGKKAERPRA